MQVKKVAGKDINPKKDLFLGETSVQIYGFSDDYPSVHIVRSYVTLDENKNWGAFYHIFDYKVGTTAINYNYKEWKQVKNLINLSKHWQVFYRDEDGTMMPVSRRWEENFDEETSKFY